MVYDLDQGSPTWLRASSRVLSRTRGFLTCGPLLSVGSARRAVSLGAVVTANEEPLHVVAAWPSQQAFPFAFPPCFSCILVFKLYSKYCHCHKMDINASAIDYKRTRYTYECWLPLVYSLLPVLTTKQWLFLCSKGCCFYHYHYCYTILTIIIIVIVGAYYYILLYII